MKATLESTDKVVTIVVDGVDVPARVWQGETQHGVPFHAFITRVAVDASLPPESHEQFKRELAEAAAPRFEVHAIPLRMVL